MDIEGLGKLIEQGRSENSRQFDDLKNMYKDQKNQCDSRFEHCDSRMDDLCKSVKSHGKTITQIKTIGSLASLVWGAIVLFASHIVSEMVGK